MPVSNVSVFVGRDNDLQAVDALLMQSSRANIAAAVGMGGVGKTELALQYARRRGDAFLGGVCWLRGVEPIAAQIVSFAQNYLDLQVPEQLENPVAWCLQRWPQAGERAGPVLMVVDDVQDYGALKLLLPSNERFRVLLTMRQAILPVGQRLALEVLVPGAALELLTSLVGEARLETALADAEALCEWVGRLPLGIELVGWYLARRPELTVAKLLERLEGKRLAAKALVETHPEMRATLGVAAAFEVSWEPLSAEGKTLAGLLGLFAAAPIDWQWVQQACEQMRAALDEELLEDAQAELLWVNLLQVTGPQDRRRYQVHPLVREFFALKLGGLTEAEGLQRGFAQAMTEVAKTIPQAVTLAVRSQVTEAVPHMEEIAAQWTEVLEGTDKRWCCIGLARFHESLSQWQDAEQWRQKEFTVSQTQLGDHHPDTATSLNNLAELYRSQGRYEEAKPLCVEALNIRKAELGDRHPDTAQSLNNLATLHFSQGHYEEAEPLYVEALEIRKAELGDRHPVAAQGLHNLALLYSSQGRYKEAEPLYVEALEIWKTELGDHHPDTAQGLNDLAVLYKLQGRYAKAEPLYVEALNIRKAELGDRHPNTAQSLNNLATLYSSQERYIEAEPLCVEALEIWKTELGDRHPDTAQGLNNLAALYYSQGRYGESEPLYMEALGIRKAELGDRHPNTAQGLFNLAALYYQTQRPQQALSHIQQALDIYIPTLGIDHPTTKAAMNWQNTIQQAVHESS